MFEVRSSARSTQSPELKSDLLLQNDRVFGTGRDANGAAGAVLFSDRESRSTAVNATLDLSDEREPVEIRI